MPNLFDEENGEFLVLVNSEGQHSLWPSAIGVPDGWTEVFGASDRISCLAYVEENWTDMRPLTLIRAMAAESNVTD
jgi:MbtH protein